MKKAKQKLELKKEAITILDNLQASNVLGGGEGESSLSIWTGICCFSFTPKCTSNTGPGNDADEN
ncbi:MAG: hypothetical protein RR555_09995 [Bacteroidales bacterium]